MIEHSQPSKMMYATRWKVLWLAAMLTIGISCNAIAGVVTDGSIGAVQSLSGNMTIPETLGKLSGSNLFHSFQTFNILTNESANFTTTTSGIANVISRVTGGSLSQINGPLSLTPCAGCGAPNFFFINPAGVTFGAGASIDVPGAFHVSTADYVKFPDGNFHADLNQASTFSVAPPSAFGFLGTTRASITVNDGATLSTQPLQPISVVAGDVEINNGTVSTLNGGDIRVVAIGQGTQNVGFTGVLPAAYGNLSILNGGSISADTLSSDNAGSVKVNAGNITLDSQWNNNFTGISSVALAGTGNAGRVDVTVTGDFSIVNNSEIDSSTFSSGNAGGVKINARSITIDSQGSSNSSSRGMPNYTGLSSDAMAGSTGNAGTIEVSISGTLSAINGGQISSSTFSSGNAGGVKINARSITINSQGSSNFSSQGILTGISSAAFIGSTGNAGILEVSTNGNLSISNGGTISSSTYSQGCAGHVNVNSGSLTVDGTESRINALASAGSSGQTGSVNVTATDSITLSNGGELSISNDATVTVPSVLNHTSINVTAPRITILNSPNAITTASTGNVAAGSININASDKLFLDPSGITTTSNLGNGGAIDITADILTLNNSQIATSVLGLTGNGGNIAIAANTLILNTGFIQANTAAANATGGTVSIAAQNLIPAGNILFLGGSVPYTYQPGVFGFNVIQAAAPTGVSGTVHTTSPSLDISGSLTGLGAQVIDAGGLGRSPCQATGGSSLSQSGRGGLPPSARGLLRAELPFSAIKSGSYLPISGNNMRVASSSWGCS